MPLKQPLFAPFTIITGFKATYFSGESHDLEDKQGITRADLELGFEVIFSKLSGEVTAEDGDGRSDDDVE